MGTSASFARKALLCLAAALLAFTLVPTGALAGQENVESSVEEPQEANSAQADEAAGASMEADGSTSVASLAEGGTLAASLIGKPASFVNADVALDGDPVIGSFTVDGLTFAVIDGLSVELVGVSETAGASPRRVVAESQGLSAPLALPDLGSTPIASETEADDSVSETDSSVFALPESVAYGDVEYSVTSIGAYAFYLSGVTSVELPATVADVDERAFRSSDVASVEVAEGNAFYSSFDGALYSADQLSLLLIPEGKQGAVLLPKGTEVAEAGKFSHCSLVDAISAEDGAAFASENGLLYDASLTTLLRVPAGATEIAIREGCTTIAAGAMEGCASLATINAPASITSISSDVFTSVPTVSLPVATLAEDAPQLTALVALSSTDDDLPGVDPAAVQLRAPDAAEVSPWAKVGFLVESDDALEGLAVDASLQSAAHYSALDTTGMWICAPTSEMYWYIYRAGSSPVWVRGDFEVAPYVWTWWEFPAADFASCLNASGTVIRRLSGAGLGQINGVHFNHPANINWVPWFIVAMNQGNATTIKYGTSPDNLAALGSSDVRSFNASGMQGQLYVSFDDADQYAVSVSWDLGGATAPDGVTSWARKGTSIAPPRVVRDGFRFLGWFSADGVKVSDGSGSIGPLEEDATFYARWTQDFDLVFDTSSEPDDEDYPGMEKPDETVNINDGPTVIEDPKRPGYVFQGWVMPSESGTEAIDQDLVYKDETDGKWYVDASKLPDYADDSGRVELTARWTSVISVDVPSAVTFYADVVTQGNESREGAASSAFGQNKVASQSEVDLRIVGLESEQVRGDGSTALGASDILKKAASATPSASTQKLFSLYPTSKALAPDDLQDPDAVSTTKPADAVDFALDDILLERSFAAEKFTIPAGDTLNLGYRLNLSETGTELDYEKLSILDEGQSASIANISYCFAAEASYQINPTGSKDDPLWVELSQEDSYALGSFYAAPGIYGLADIKKAADDLSRCEASPSLSIYYKLVRRFFDNRDSFHLQCGGSYYDVQIIGLCQDYVAADMMGSRSGSMAGLTFCFKDAFAAGDGSIACKMNDTATAAGGWAASAMRSYLQEDLMGLLDARLQSADTGIVPVAKAQQLSSHDSSAVGIQRTTDTIFLLSYHEIFGAAHVNYNNNENASNSIRYEFFSQEPSGLTNSAAIKVGPQGETMEYWWLRSVHYYWTVDFGTVRYDGTAWNNPANESHGIVPAFCL